jgi:hypothetical protein
VPDYGLRVEPADAVSPVADEPQEVLQDSEEYHERKHAQFGGGPPSRQAHSEGGVGAKENEHLGVEVVTGQRLFPQPPGPAVVDAPGGQASRPAVAALDLDFEQSESGRGGEQKKGEDCMLHGEVDAVRGRALNRPPGRTVTG